MYICDINHKLNAYQMYKGCIKKLDTFHNILVDKSPHKQGKLLPGSHIPIVSEEKINEIKPEYVLIFPWNIKEEIINQLSYARKWNVKFVVAVPELKII